MRSFSFPEAIQLKRSPARSREFAPVAHIMDQGWPGDEERSLRCQLAEIKWRDRAARLSKEDQITGRTQTIEALFKSSRADGVVDHMDSRAAGQPFYLCTV